jgi:hypothetical protein
MDGMDMGGCGIMCAGMWLGGILILVLLVLLVVCLIKKIRKK